MSAPRLDEVLSEQLGMPVFIDDRVPNDGIYVMARAEDEPCPDCGLRCDICDDRMCATYGPAPATTCAAHRHCEDCDTDNPCRDCKSERRAA